MFVSWLLLFNVRSSREPSEAQEEKGGVGSSVSLSDEAKKSLEAQAAHEADDTAGKQWLSRAVTWKLHGDLKRGQSVQRLTSRT